ncbi:glycosyltransferase [Silvimonas iriomotensis]|uniref:Glycosyl transferase n=1 Tax=Silvimonas iriomotensis TaxID=449662 RepID=A0ABQ2PBR5_9NEIS|nr:glycosyltransferase [Silvimonas iriomotensis]GGP22955.1 glycosyl transferase [Silvimonas iriomotensis]
MVKRRILFHQTHFLRGGIETSLISLLRALDRQQFEIGLTITYPTEALETLYRAQIPADVAVHVLAPEGWLSYFRQKKTQGKLGLPGKIYEEGLLPLVRRAIVSRRFRKIAAGYDAVVDYDMSLSRLTGRLALPMLGYSHFSVAHLPSQNPRKLRKLRKQTSEHYDRVVLLNDTMLADIQALIPDQADKFVRLYNSIDLARIREQGQAGPAPLAEPYMVSVGRLQESQKDFTSLLRAYALLVKDGITEKLAIVGEGKSRLELQALAAELGIADRVVFAGFQTNPYVWMQHARLMVFSSKMEGLPNVLLEAMALGQLVISTDCPVGPREILAEGKAGLLVPVGDVAGLAHAMKQGLQDEPTRTALLDYAAQHIEQMGFGPTAAAFASCVDNLIKAHP